LKRSRLKLRSVDAGWEITDIPADHLQDVYRKAIRDYNVSAHETGKMVVEVAKNGPIDAEDRIQIGASLLKSLADSGL